MCTKFENRLENQTWHWKISQKKWKDLGNLLGKLRQQQPSCREVTWKRNIQDQWSCVDVEMHFIVIAHSPEIQTGDVNKFQYYTFEHVTCTKSQVGCKLINYLTQIFVMSCNRTWRQAQQRSGGEIWRGPDWQRWTADTELSGPSCRSETASCSLSAQI